MNIIPRNESTLFLLCLSKEIITKVYDIRAYNSNSIELELSIYGNEMGVLPLRQGVKETMDLP